MKYKESDMARASDGRSVYEITELDEGELLGKAMGELKNEGKIVITMSNSGFSWGQELEKLGIDYEALADSWGIPAEIIRSTVMGQPPEFYRADEAIGELMQPLGTLAYEAVLSTWSPKELARDLVRILTTADLRKLDKPQLSMATAAKYAGVEEERLARFFEREDCLTPEEISRVCISLLIVDRTLNYRSRRDLFWMGENEE